MKRSGRRRTLKPPGCSFKPLTRLTYGAKAYSTQSAEVSSVCTAYTANKPLFCFCVLAVYWYPRRSPGSVHMYMFMQEIWSFNLDRTLSKLYSCSQWQSQTQGLYCSIFWACDREVGQRQAHRSQCQTHSTHSIAVEPYLHSSTQHITVKMSPRTRTPIPK